jgi:antibiotic biosynthesis monooxygenase (ABM) superfamily enzyme
VLPVRNDDFATLLQRINDAVAAFPGFVDHQVIPPNPPAQVDWVIVQKFASSEQAQAWLHSQERQGLIATAQPMLVGHDDIHVVVDDVASRPPEAVSAMISMRITPGQDEAFHAWGRRIAAAQAKYPGFQGYKIDPPVPGIQDDWVTVLQFDTEEHLNAWMTSPERLTLLEEAKPFATETHYRTVRSGFEQWFRVGGAVHAPAWKQNMLVLLALYPTVFLFGYFVQTPILMRQLEWPFWLALFAANVAGVVILNWVVPWVSQRFRWWLQPAGRETEKRNLIGIVVVVALYGVALFAFSWVP